MTKDQSGVASPLYPNTARAFDALIRAEVQGEMLLSSARHFQSVFARYSKDDTPEYQEEPEDYFEDELKAEIAERRRAVTGFEKRVQDAADRYHRDAKKLLASIDDAKLAVEAAARELDDPRRPPLERTSVDIKRALRNLTNSLPGRFNAGWAEVTRQEVQDGIRESVLKLLTWIAELRLLVQPQHTLEAPIAFMPLHSVIASAPPAVSPDAGGAPSARGDATGATRRPAKSRRRKKPGATAQRKRLAEAGDLRALADRLTTQQIRVLRALGKQRAVSRDDAVSKPYLAQHEFGGTNPKNLGEVCSELVRLGLTSATPGQNGGSWLTNHGLAALRFLGEITDAHVTVSSGSERASPPAAGREPTT